VPHHLPYSYQSVLLSLRDELELRDFQQFFSIIFKGCVEECANDSALGIDKKRETVGRKKIRRGTEKDLYFLARKSSALRKVINLFIASVADIGDAMRFGASLKVIRYFVPP
jgi:hypothetical protein